MAYDLSEYTGRITSRHIVQPNFMATVTALVQPFIDNQIVLDALTTDVFDIDTAVGVQLDQIGQWIGRSRQVAVPLSGVYFSLDTAGLGFDQGTWQGAFDPTTGVVALDDTTYRALLYAKIILNSWDGTVEQAAQALSLIFSLSPGTQITIQDNQDMTMFVGVSGVVPPTYLVSLLRNNEFDIRPDGVDLTYLFTSLNSVPLFGFDVETAAISGFDVGSWDGSLPGQAPGQVTQFVVSSVTSTTASFRWVAPTVGTGFTYYLLYRLASSTGAFTSIGPYTLTAATISGLTASTAYQVEIYATTLAGNGPVSLPITATTTAGPPAQVTGLVQTATTATSVSLSWTAVANATSYTTQYALASGGAWITGPSATGTATTISGLAAATVYDFQVTATNANGAGTPSAVLVVGTLGSVPGVVTNLAAVPGLNDIALTWTNPTTGTGPYTFTVRYAANVVPVVYTVFTGTITITATGGSCDITGLTANTAYLVTVAATSGAGSGATSNPLSVTTSAGPPAQVTGLTVGTLTSTAVTLNWNPVTNTTAYQVYYRLMGTSAWTTGPNVTVPTVTATVTGLVSGYTYEFEVVAIGP